MQITFTGTAGAGGVPRYGCECTACVRARQQPEYQRRPCSALVETDQVRLLLDAGLMDIHGRFPAGSLNAIVLTHFHADHVQGLFHLRWGKGSELPVFCPPDPDGCADLYKNSGILDFRQLEAFRPFEIGDLKITPLPLNHSKITYGYAIETVSGQRFAYLTDTVGLPEPTEQFLKSWGAFSLALDCSYSPEAIPPVNHNDFNLAMDIITSVAPRHAWLTHLSHQVDCWRLETDYQLVTSASWAADGIIIRL
jgi:phosphoribosyl 1,2-cyclic phosphate phosphodiesterase